ncbi:MAG: gluconate 2-dehydrogenase subunit 3 family protein [Chloroflexi bacterium]|nr:gluconate 2-dehydrogenase subunit 3 family protein [Chloroflexota bacterium]
MDVKTMTTTNEILSADQRALLSAALNCIIPAQGEMPAAGDLDIGGFVESVAAGNAESRRRLLEGLVQIQLVAAEQGGDFQALPADAQMDALRAVESSASEFFQYLVTQTYRGYYTNETVTSLLSYRAPNRQDYDPLPFDDSLLEPVRQRGQIWVPTNG